MKGMLPSEHEMASADALLKRAIDSKTMPTDVTNVWDGKPYEPSPEFNQKITDSFALFHAVITTCPPCHQISGHTRPARHPPACASPEGLSFAGAGREEMG